MEIIDIAPKYARFFLQNLESRHLILQGSRRSAKSWNVYKYIALLSSGSSAITTYVVASTYPACMLAVEDFQKSTGVPVTGSTIIGYHATFRNGSRVIFKAFDDPTKAQGTSCDYAVIEEALNVPEQVISVLSMSVRKQMIFIYNPTKSSYLDKYILADRSNYLKTTWKDNPYLTEAQREEFEGLKERALRPNASVLDTYNYRVYYCGDFQAVGGKVFMDTYTCSDEEFDNIPCAPSYGLDFGIVDSRDQTALVAVKVFEGSVYAKELIYSNHLANNKDLALRLAEIGLDCYDTIYADWGGLGKERMKALATAGDYSWTEEGINRGFNIVNAKKGKIIDGLQRILQFDRIVLTESSPNLHAEMDSYELSPEGKPKGADHAIDAFRYALISSL